ncbi:MAG: SpoIIE family protein phosphatase, partial [Bacteroidia bacterium]|nr:SpoIIE family protein phosphatase [Bacteroidia bacterium]
GIGADLGNIGSVYLSQNNYAKALDFFNKALAISKNMGDKSQTAIWYANIGSVNFKQNNFIEAEKYLKDALQLDQEIASLEGQIEDHKSLYDLYEKINNPEAALFHYKSYTHLKDSVYSEENTKNLVKAGMNFEFEKKETISRAKQERQRLIIYSIGAIAVLLILLVFFVYNRYKIIQKQKEIIEQQKKEVEHQREIVLEEKKISEERKQEILDSIHYASRIQQAMLTSTDYITKHLACDYFILYLPKDIVAGDFYWAIKQHNLFYIITADCTGHGVPGAFMSLLNIGFLNELVIERNLKMPCDILNEQRKQIIHALNPKGNENSKDGMDCVLSAFDLENNKLYFSAANNPLCLVRNNELIDYKAQKIPVGKSERENESFALTEINLQKEDIIYTFTDGFPDQFGTNGKKFMSKKLKNLLIQINQLPMEAQKEQLLQAFHNHKGNEEQTDDILVIGVRV